MPTIKIKNPDGTWKYVNEPSSNADTLDGKHADEFAAASDVEALQTKVGDTSVSEQLQNLIDKTLTVSGKAADANTVGHFVSTAEGNFDSIYTSIDDINGTLGIMGPMILNMSWDTLPGRPFGAETILPTAIRYADSDEGLIAITEEISLEIGNTYNVSWNGQVYTCECKPFNYAGSTFPTLGNPSIFGGEDTGEPFCIIIMDTLGEGVYGAICLLDGSDVVMVGITSEDNIQTIDSRFIGDDIARVSDIPEMPDINYPVTKVNGKTGDIELTANDVGADIAGAANTALGEANLYTDNSISELAEGFEQVITMMYQEDMPEEGIFPTIRSIANDESNSAISEWVGDKTVSEQITTAIASKSDIEHTHSIDDINNLQSVLDNKETRGAANTALESAKSYTDTKISDLINSAPTTLDTLGEIATAMSENEDVVKALEEAVGVKANATDVTNHINNKSNPHGVTAAQVGADVSGSANAALESAKAYTDSEIVEWVGDKKVSEQITTATSNLVVKVDGKGLSANDYTTTEKNKLAGIADGANKTVVDTALSSSSTNPVQNKVVNSAISDLGISVKTYGAKGDGSTNDTTAFQNALNTNRRVFVPGGIYKISDTILIGQNCELELSQDTVLEFTMTSGNCISMDMSASIKGNHATVRVPYTFTGNAIYISTGLTVSTSTVPPFAKWCPQWKSGRYISDLNIVKPDTRGFHYSIDGKCNGTAIYVHANNNDNAKYMWGNNFTGLRIAGAFSFGFRAVTENGGWLHDMHADGFIDAAETAVSLENAKNTYISFIIQPRPAEDTNGNHIPYAKYGIYLNNSRNVDLSNSRVWDWDSENTLYTTSNQYQHLVMIGDCSGTILNEFTYHISPFDIRDIIYTDTPSNLDKIIIIQEPLTRWFKPEYNSELFEILPKFNDGDFEKRVILKEEFDECISSTRTPNFTNALLTAKGLDGKVLNGIGYYKYNHRWTTTGTLAEVPENYGCTGLIPITANDTIYTKALWMGKQGIPGVILFDSNYNFLTQGTDSNIGTMSYYFDFTETEEGFILKVKKPANVAYVAFSFNHDGIGVNPIISVNNPITYTQTGYLTDGIKVKSSNVEGLSEMLGSYITDIDALIGGGA